MSLLAFVRRSTERTRSIAAAATAGSFLALLWPSVASLNTELHTSAMLTGIRILGARVARRVPWLDPGRSRFHRWLITLAPACAASWRLLVAAPTQTGTMMLTTTAAGAGSAFVANCWRRGALAHLRLAAAPTLIGSGATAGSLRALAMDAAAAGAVATTFGALLAAGPAACARYGWSAGLSLLPLRRRRRSELSARLSYHALLSLLLVRAAPENSTEDASMKLLGAAFLAIAFASMMHEHACAVEFSASPTAAPPPLLALDWSLARTAHFLLGFDESDEQRND